MTDMRQKPERLQLCAGFITWTVGLSERSSHSCVRSASNHNWNTLATKLTTGFRFTTVVLAPPPGGDPVAHRDRVLILNRNGTALRAYGHQTSTSPFSRLNGSTGGRAGAAGGRGAGGGGAGGGPAASGGV